MANKKLERQSLINNNLALTHKYTIKCMKIAKGKTVIS